VLTYWVCAGKTTLISVLTGLHHLTGGSVMIGGYDVTRNQDLVRRLVGICPQHDILWDVRYASRVDERR
jgi:ATP-binding cassette subfamily A (ABC1) protein 3